MTIADPLDARMDINLHVRSLVSSATWYERIFGAPPIYRGTDRAMDGHAVPLVCFRLGGTKVWLLPAGEGWRRVRSTDVGISLMTRQPLAPLRQLLQARGARFDDGAIDRFPVNDDGVRVGRDAEFLYMLDPDDHRIEYCRVFDRG